MQNLGRFILDAKGHNLNWLNVNQRIRKGSVTDKFSTEVQFWIKYAIEGRFQDFSDAEKE